MRSAQYTHQATTATTDGPATNTARRHDHHTAITSATASTTPLGRTSAAPTATSPAARSWCSSTSTNAHTDAARKIADGYVIENTNDAGKRARDHTERAATRGPPRRDANRYTPASATRNTSWLSTKMAALSSATSLSARISPGSSGKKGHFGNGMSTGP